ncbi:MAG: glucosamine-6-phosphate deaminase [Chloroflexi bacterium]|nr:glucosamine-6-phosphate deaminase [Chloroflexota bacterium]
MNPTLISETKWDDLLTSVYGTNEDLGAAAAAEAEQIIQAALADRGEANIIVATGNSQLTFLEALRVKPIDWSKVNVFHMDEYLGLAPTHPASFPAFLRRHFLNNVTPKVFFPVVSHDRYPEAVCHEYAAALRAHPIDLTALGIGENGHLAFNDPPFAEFNDPAWVKVIRLAEASRRQQVGEGHFKSMAEVPTHAITLTIPALLSAKRVLAIVPEARKADAVQCSLRGPISEDCPGSILRKTPHAHLFLDQESAAKL